MRIGFFCNELPPRPHGGIGTFVREITCGLVRAGHQVTVVEFGDEAGTRGMDGIRIVTLPEVRARGAAWLANRVKLLLWLKAAVRRGEIDVFELPDFQGWLPFPYEPCPVVVRLHLAQTFIEHVLGGAPKSRLMYELERQTLRYHRCWIGVSQYILEAERSFFRCAPRSSKVIYYPVPATDGGGASPSTSPDGPYFLFVGSVSERKGALALAEAASPLLEEYPELRLVYIGAETRYQGRPISEEIRQRVGPLVANRVAFLGFLPHAELYTWMARATALVLPSRVESFGLVVVEAMSIGTPVVFSREGPGRELIEDGVTGLLVDPHDPNSIRQALRRLLSDPLSARALGERGRRFVIEGRFRLDRCVAETVAFYGTVLIQHRGNSLGAK
jgi:glycosyltransferase involved in cell wall biosynthesis